LRASHPVILSNVNLAIDITRGNTIWLSLYRIVIYEAVELLKDNGFDGLAQAVTVLMNAAMVAAQ
jgi:hypothetical protein